MKAINNGFSIGRVMRLLRMEAHLYGRQYALFLGISICIVLLGWSTAYFFSNGGISWEFFFAWLIMGMTVIYTLFYIGNVLRRVHKGEGIVYCAVPATTPERMTHLAILGLLHYVAALLVAQLCFLVDLAVTSDVAVSSARWSAYIIPGSVFIDPFFAFGERAQTILLLAGMWYGMIKFRTIPGVVAAVTATATVQLGVSYLGLLIGIVNFLDGEVFLSYFSYALSAVLFVASYFELSKLQQRQ